MAPSRADDEGRGARARGLKDPCFSSSLPLLPSSCGGTWASITSKLDYIQGMGFDAVWISPVVENIGGSTGHGEAYHGYWGLDITKINSKFGTEADLKALSAALHSRGMLLMVRRMTLLLSSLLAPQLTASLASFRSTSSRTTWLLRLRRPSSPPPLTDPSPTRATTILSASSIPPTPIRQTSSSAGWATTRSLSSM